MAMGWRGYFSNVIFSFVNCNNCFLLQNKLTGGKINLYLNKNANYKYAILNYLVLYAINTVLLYKNWPLLYAITCFLGAIYAIKNRVWLLYAITIFGLLLYAIYY